VAKHRPTDPCHSCMRHHAPPACDWQSESPCPRCALPLGYKGDDAQGEECFWCWSGWVRRVCDGPGEVRERVPDWVDGL
jgi:hypothetical protein